jgi:hypothetical protein
MAMVDKSEKFTQLVRVGYFSRAILYGLLGILALTSAGRISEGTNSVFRSIEDFPGGVAVLWLLVIGLTAYALFRFASTVFDIERNGSDAKGWATRIGHAGSGIAHLALAWAAFSFATSGTATSSDSTAQDAAAGVLSMSLGPVLLGLAGLVFIAAAAHQAKKAYTGDFMQRISSRAPDATRYIGGAGFVARAVVYAIIGWSLMQAGWFSSTGEVETLGGAIVSLSDDGVWFTLLAIGLLAFGLFSLILARYAIIPDVDVRGRMPASRA